MSSKVFVGSLPWATTDQDLADLFRQAGNVTKAEVIRDRMSGRSRGFGFVEFETADEAQKAIEMFHGYEMSGRALTVNIAQERTERPPRREGGYNGGGRGGYGGGQGGYSGGRGGYNRGGRSNGGDEY